MAYIKKKSERKFKITVCNGYKVNGQKRMKAQIITVPSSVPKRGIQQYVMAEAERIEKKFKYGVEESDQTHFEQYAENWLKRQEPISAPAHPPESSGCAGAVYSAADKFSVVKSSMTFFMVA